jgi:sarcosine oxidase, subunit alpha
MYTGRFKNLKVGSMRYAVMCDEAGVVVDDGVVARLGHDRFYATSTTSAAAAVYREMQRNAIVWGMNVMLVNATAGFSAMNLAGPHARRILQSLVEIDLADAAVPFMSIREVTVAGIPARILRVGFVGELGYEIHVPADYARHVWDALMTAGRVFAIQPFGVEAQRVLRLEKGHAIVSQDTDGLTNPFEAGLEWAVKDDKPFFVGQRSLRALRQQPMTRKLVGFSLTAEEHRLPRESHLVFEQDTIVGRVTSIARSPTLGMSIGLAFVAPAQAIIGTPFSIRVERGLMVTANVVPIPFYDPQASRQRLA